MSSANLPDVASAAGPKRSGGLNGRAALHAIRSHPLIVAAAVCLGGAVAVGVWLFLPVPKATAVVVFHIGPQQHAAIGQPQEPGMSLQSYRLAQIAMLKRRLTLTKVVAQPGVADLEVIRNAKPEPVVWLDHQLKVVESRTPTEFVRVTLEGDKGDDLRVILDAVAKAYLADSEDRDKLQRKDLLRKLEVTQENYRKEIGNFKDRISTIAQILTYKDGATIAAVAAGYRHELEIVARDWRTAQEDVVGIEAELRKLGALPPRPGEPAPPAPPPISDAVIGAELQADMKMQGLEAAVTRAREAARKTEDLVGGPDVMPVPQPLLDAREAVKKAEAARDGYRAERRPAIEARIRQSQQRDIDARIAELQGQLAQRMLRGTQLTERRTELEKKLGRFSEYAGELDELNGKIASTEALRNQVGVRIEQIKMELDAPHRVTMTEEAYVLPGIEGNRRMKFALMGGLGVLLAGLVGIVVWESRSRRVTHADEVTTDLGVRLLGTVPPLPSSTAGAHYAVPPAAVVEAIDTTRTMLLHGGPSGAGPRTVLVTSAVAGEGKTSLSGHLAISLARAGFRTLLVDGDLHSPSAHRLYELPIVPGLCEVLRGEAAAAAAVRQSPIPGLSILPAGHWDLAARQSLVGDRWRQIQQELVGRFDFLVIDTAPLLQVSDTLLLAREADGVVISVLLGVSHIAHIAETTSRLEAIGARLTGAVVNGVWHSAYHKTYQRLANGPGEAPAATDEPAGAQQ